MPAGFQYTGFEYTEDRFNFNNIFSKSGGVRMLSYPAFEERKKDQLDFYLEKMNQLAEIVIKSYILKSAPAIYIDYIENYTLGAAVAKKDNTYHIGNNLGSFFCNIFFSECFPILPY